MPTTYAHFRFGHEGLSLLPFEDNQIIEHYRALYDIGVHGPDIFFYYKPWENNHVNSYGYEMHKKPMINFLKSAREAYKHSSHKDAIKAYVYGFCAHFALDSFCHTYVEEKSIADPEATHDRIETEFDRFLMEMDGIDPLKESPAFSLRPSRKKSKLIAEIFPQFNPETIFAATKSQKLLVDLLTSKNFVKRGLLLKTLQISGQDRLKYQIMEKTCPDCCRDSNAVLEGLFNTALEKYPELIKEVKEYLENGTEPSSYFNRHFGAWYETD